MANGSNISGAVAVLGGGITGIQAALDLTSMGFKVYLIEQKPAIGGYMAMLDKTFPTNDCSLCILSPKLVECGRHRDIEILTLTEVLGLDGKAGNFTLRLRKNPRYVDEAKCTSCGLCVEKCPVKIPNEYEQGLTFRKAIYKYYPQAIPNSYAVDKTGYPPDFKGCVMCHACEKVCGSGAINLDAEPEDVSLEVGAVILADGADAFKPYVKKEYGYGAFVNVVTSLEYERILSASGPYEGHILRPGDRKVPDNIAWIQCVGSRDKQIGNNYCSSVCCMYATKEAIITKEHAHDVATTIFYIDMRSYGKDFDRYVERAQDVYGVRYVRSKISEIVEDPETTDLLIRYEDDQGNLKEEAFGMVVLSVGLCPSEDKRRQMESLGIALNAYGFCRTDGAEPVRTSREGIFVAGSIGEPMAIPEAVMQATAAAAQAARLLSPARGSQVTEKTYPAEKDVSGLAARIGVFVCHCGVNIAGYLNIDELVRHAAALPDVVYADHLMYACAQDSQKKITELISEYQINRVIIAACTPRTHEALFQETLREAGLNPYLFEMANIREQCSWIHMEAMDAATEKAKDLIAMAVAKARLLEPIQTSEIGVTPAALVIGGGVAGMTSALALADQGYKTYLIEKQNRLGGRLHKIRYTIDGMDIPKLLEELSCKIARHELVEVLTEATVSKIEGFVGNFVSEIACKNETRKISHGAIVVAIGAEDAATEDFLYGCDKRVITQHELEERLSGLYKGELRNGETFVMVQCVESRNDAAPYCSRVCCAHAIKNALKIKEINPRAEVYVLYRDIRTYGFREEYYEAARDKGVIFLRYDKDAPPAVSLDGNTIRVKVKEQFLRREIEIPADYVALSLGMRPAVGREEIARMLKVPLNEDGFFLEAHVKLRPVDFATEGIFLAGTCHAPKFLSETISQAQAAAGRVARILAHSTYKSTAEIAVVNPDLCSGCGVCAEVCSYSAIELKSETVDGNNRIRASINESLCKGCGCCVASCRSGAIDLKGFTNCQLEAMISAALHSY